MTYRSHDGPDPPRKLIRETHWYKPTSGSSASPLDCAGRGQGGAGAHLTDDGIADHLAHQVPLALLDVVLALQELEQVRDLPRVRVSVLCACSAPDGDAFASRSIPGEVPRAGGAGAASP